MDKTLKLKKEKEQKPKYNLWQNSAYMMSLAWEKHKSVIWFCIILAVLAVTSSILSLLITPAILGAVESAVPLGELITVILLFAGGLMLVNAANSYISTNTSLSKISIRVSVVAKINDKISMMSYPLTENQDVQKKRDKAHMATNSNDSATEAIWGTLTNLLTNIMGFSIYLILLSALEFWIIGLVLATTVTGFFINKYINGWGYRHRDEEAEYSRRMNYISGKAGDYTLAKDIRIFGMRGWLTDMYESSLRLYQAFIARGERVYIWANIVDIILSFARNGVAYFYLINLVLSDGLSASQFLLYFTAVGGFTGWVSGILSEFATLHRQSLDLSAVREFLEYDEPFKFEDGETIEPDMSKGYQIELRNVSFRYPGAEADTLKNINLIIKPGEKLAVVGLNGAGKTTLVKLICGFYDPAEGEVLMNGENIKKYNRRDYYRHFSAVFQDFSILATTIAENISQTVKPADMDMEKMRDCAEKSGLAGKIDGLPEKYETHVTKTVYEDGIEFSGGETQRLMLARALYKNAPLIILDEPTAALDPIAESDMYNKYNEFAGGRTSVYISHRLASTRFCDRVIFINDGMITEEGTHDVLVTQDGKYAELFEIQSHYYREGVAENEKE
jgi:ATP-binding cassette subfamily B protein